MFVKTKAKTNRLWCSSCNTKIEQGSKVIFETYCTKRGEEKMRNVYCHNCLEEFIVYVDEENLHPFSAEALGQM